MYCSETLPIFFFCHFTNLKQIQLTNIIDKIKLHVHALLALRLNNIIKYNF